MIFSAVGQKKILCVKTEKRRFRFVYAPDWVTCVYFMYVICNKKRFRKTRFYVKLNVFECFLFCSGVDREQGKTKKAQDFENPAPFIYSPF